MKRVLIFFAIMLAASLALLGIQGTPSQTGNAPSLGDLARHIRAERAKEPIKPVKVFTNDNLPATESLGTEASTSGAKERSSRVGENNPPSSNGTSLAHDEKYYRKKMADLKSQKEMHQRELEVLEKKFAQNEMQYYPNPYQTAVQQFTRSDINSLQQDIDKKKEEIAADDKAMSDLEDQLRREGGAPGWLR